MALPRFDPGIPGTIDVFKGENSTADMAEVLLREGLIREEDWCGDFADSIEAGLNQWVNDALGSASLNILRLEFVFTDDVEHAGIYNYTSINPGDWIQEAKGIDGKPIAVFALRVTQYEQIFTGKAVLDLEEIEPGAGYSLFHILCSALYATVDAATPAWAWSEMKRQDEWEEENEETDPLHAIESDHLNLESFEKGIPRETYRWDLTARQCCNRLSSACARIAGYTDTKHKAMCKALEAGVELSAMLDDFAKWRKLDKLNRCSQQYYFEETRPLLPVGVRWSGSDNIDRITDEYHDLLMQSGEETDLVWLYGYQTNAPRSIKRAITALQHVLKIVPLCDQLLQSLAGPAKFTTANKIRHRKVPLAKIFAGGDLPDSGPVPDITNL